MFNSDPVLLKARKVHRCTWCGENIEPGATYKRWVTFDAGAFTSKMHPECDGAAAEEFAEWGYDEGYLPFQNEHPAAIPSGVLVGDHQVFSHDTPMVPREAE